jgi:TetR/AcrR family transcriptional repressor of lmrAB and yxaGH operons
MLDAAESLLRERGLAGAGIKQVVARSRAPIGSVYHHFPEGKAQLAAEALRIHGEKARRLMEEVFAQDAPLPRRVRNFFRRAAKGFEETRGSKGCAIGAVTLDLGAGDTALRRVCDQVFDGWVVTLAAHLPWRDKAKRQSFAELIVTTLEGAFVLGRARKSGQPFLAAGEWLALAAESASARRDQ